MPPKAPPKRKGYPSIITTRKQAKIQTEKVLEERKFAMAGALADRLDQGFAQLQHAQNQNTAALQRTVQQTLQGLLGPQLPPGNPPQPPVLLQSINNNINDINQKLVQMPDPGIDSLCLQSFQNQPQDDPRQFLNDFNAYCQYRNFNPAKKAQLFQLLLKGTAKIWFNSQDEAVRHNWDQIHAAFTAEYIHEPTMLDQTLTDLIMHQPNQNVIDYYNLIVAACKKVNRNDQETRDTFIRNLDKPIKLFVLSRQPATLAEALQFARLAQNLLLTNTIQDNAKLNEDHTLTSSVMATSLPLQMPENPSYLPENLFHAEPGLSANFTSPNTSVSQQFTASVQPEKSSPKSEQQLLQEFTDYLVASLSCRPNRKPSRPMVCWNCSEEGHSWRQCSVNQSHRDTFSGHYRQNFNSQFSNPRLKQHFNQYQGNGTFQDSVMNGQNDGNFRLDFANNYPNQQPSDFFSTQDYNEFDFRDDQYPWPQSDTCTDNLPSQDVNQSNVHPSADSTAARSQVHFISNSHHLN